MSALNCIVQRDRVILCVDGAAYSMDTGIIQGFPTKAAAVPSWPGAVATRGAVMATPLFAHLLSSRFQTFDDMVAGIEDEICDVHAQVKKLCCNQGADEPIVIAGWSNDRNRPEAYMIRTSENDASCATVEENAETMKRAILPDVYKLTPLGAVTISPFVKQSGTYKMTELLELQRQNRYRSSNGGEPFCGVGGFGLMSVVDKDGVRQRVFHRWKEDRIGERIAPGDDKRAVPVDPTPKLSDVVSNIIVGPGSQLYAAATGENTMVTSPEEERRAEQETQAPSEPSAPIADERITPAPQQSPDTEWPLGAPRATPTETEAQPEERPVEIDEERAQRIGDASEQQQQQQVSSYPGSLLNVLSGIVFPSAEAKGTAWYTQGTTPGVPQTQEEITQGFLSDLADNRQDLAFQLSDSNLLNQMTRIIVAESGGTGNIAMKTAIAESILNRAQDFNNSNLGQTINWGTPGMLYFPGGHQTQEGRDWTNRFNSATSGEMATARQAISNALMGSDIIKGATGNESGARIIGINPNNATAIINGERFGFEGRGQWAAPNAPPGAQQPVVAFQQPTQPPSEPMMTMLPGISPQTIYGAQMGAPPAADFPFANPFAGLTPPSEQGFQPDPFSGLTAPAEEGFQPPYQDYGQAIGPEYGGYEPFATEGDYPLYDQPIGPQVSDFVPQLNINPITPYEGPSIPREALAPPMDVRNQFAAPVTPVERGILPDVREQQFTGLNFRGPIEPRAADVQRSELSEIAPPGWSPAEQIQGVRGGQFPDVAAPGWSPTEQLAGVRGGEFPEGPLMQGDFEQPSPMPTEEEMIAPMTPTSPYAGGPTAGAGILETEMQPFATGPGVEYPTEQQAAGWLAAQQLQGATAGQFPEQQQRIADIADERDKLEEQVQEAEQMGIPLPERDPRVQAQAERVFNGIIREMPRGERVQAAPFLDKLTNEDKVGILTGKETVMEAVARITGHYETTIRTFASAEQLRGIDRMQAFINSLPIGNQGLAERAAARASAGVDAYPVEPDQETLTTMLPPPGPMTLREPNITQTAPPGIHEITPPAPTAPAMPSVISPPGAQAPYHVGPQIAAPSVPPAPSAPTPAEINTPVAIVGGNPVNLVQIAHALASGQIDYSSGIVEDLSMQQRRLLRQLLGLDAEFG